MAFRYGFLRNDEPVKAVDPPEPSPSVFTMRIPYLKPYRGPWYAESDSTRLSVFCITTECAKASLLLARCFGLAMMLLFLVAHAIDRSAPFRSGVFGSAA
jgi:hypothetical protein